MAVSVVSCYDGVNISFLLEIIQSNHGGVSATWCSHGNELYLFPPLQISNRNQFMPEQPLAKTVLEA